MKDFLKEVWEHIGFPVMLATVLTAILVLIKGLETLMDWLDIDV